MLISAEKPITKEQYMRAQLHSGYIDPVDMGAIFSDSERFAYGVYSPTAFARYDSETNTTTYYVSYNTGTCCD